MEFVKIQKQEKVNKELTSEKINFTSTLKSLKKLGYDYVKDLGVGKFGKVVVMINQNTKTTWAVNFFKEENISDRELYVWPGLCHQNILPLLGFNYIAEDRTFTFITKCPSSLDQKLGEIEFIFDLKSLDKAISWVQDVLMDIASLHEQKMPHLDI